MQTAQLSMSTCALLVIGILMVRRLDVLVTSQLLLNHSNDQAPGQEQSSESAAAAQEEAL